MLDKVEPGDQLSAETMNTLIEYAQPKYPQDWRDEYSDFFTEVVNVQCPPSAIIPAKPKSTFGWDYDTTSEIYLIADAYPNGPVRKAAFGFQPVWTLLSDDPGTWNPKMPYGYKEGSWGLVKGWGDWRTYGPVRQLSTGEYVVRANQPSQRKPRGACYDIDCTNQMSLAVSGGVKQYQPIESFIKNTKKNKLDLNKLCGTYAFHFDFSWATPTAMPTNHPLVVHIFAFIFDLVNAKNVSQHYEAVYFNQNMMITKTASLPTVPTLPYYWWRPRWVNTFYLDMQPGWKLRWCIQEWDNGGSGGQGFPAGYANFLGTMTVLRLGDVWDNGVNVAVPT